MILRKITKKISYVLASMILMTAQMTPFFVFAPKAGADGNGSPDACLDTAQNVVGSLEGTSDAVVYNAGIGNIVDGVCIKSGEGMFSGVTHSGVLGNGTYENSCYSVTGIGTQTVTVTRIGDGPDCKGISHIDAVVKPVTGSIKVIKDSQPNSTDDFDFVVKKGQTTVDSFELEDDGDNGDSQSDNKTLNNLVAGTYVVSESPDELGWILHDIVCTGGNGITKDIANMKVTIELGMNENFVCTFVNKPKPETGSVKVNKKVDTDGNGVYDGGNTTANNIGFKWALDSELIDNSMGTSQSNVIVGEHSVTENTVSGYAFTGWYYTAEYDDEGQHQKNCNYPRGTTLPINITVEKNNTKEITLCNKKIPNGYVKVIKDVVNNNGGTKTSADFTFKNNLGDTQTFVATTSPDGERVLTLPVGSGFSITENEANAYGYNTSYSGSCSGTVTSTMKTCTITNDDKAPTLEVGKRVINDNGGTVMSGEFDLYVNGVLLTDDRRGGGEVSDNGVWYLHGNTKANTVYTITEDEVNGYDKTSLVCTDVDTQLLVSHPVNLSLGQKVSCTITNNDKPVTITATKIVCDNESLLPNYGNGGPNITPQTAIDWVTNNSGCKLAVGWSFEYAFNNAINPGDNKEVGGGGWTPFGPTNSLGQTSTEINTTDVNRIWIREQLKDGYLGFTYNANDNTNIDAVSAELYCHNDVLNYDNYDFIDRPTIGSTYYCVAWNVAEKGRVEVTKFNDANNNRKWDDDEETLPDWEMELTPIDECEEYESFDVEEDVPKNDCDDPETITEKTNSDGVAIFSNVISGKYIVGEDDKAGWDQTVIYCEEEEYVSRTSENETKEIYVGAGQTVRCYIGNYDTPGGGGNGGDEKGTIIVTKFNDANNNKVQDAGEPNMPGWEIVIEGQGIKLTKTTGLDGTVTFSELKLGNYKVSEILQDGWVQTVNFCEENTNEECVVGSEKPVNCFIGNYKKPTTTGVLGAATTTKVTPTVLATTGENLAYEMFVGLTLVAATLLTTFNRRKIPAVK